MLHALRQALIVPAAVAGIALFAWAVPKYVMHGWAGLLDTTRPAPAGLNATTCMRW